MGGGDRLPRFSFLPPVPHALVFALSTGAPGNPPTGSCWPWLLERQRQALGEGLALRIFRCPGDWEGSLDDLVASGQAAVDRADPFGGGGQLICDAVIPCFDPTRLWLTVFAAESGTDLSGTAFTRLDSFPLRDATNDTCWFYPTEDGDYLACETRSPMRWGPGQMPPETAPGTSPPAPGAKPAYDRGEIRLLWSLMADDPRLSCVGLTFRGRRIDFPIAERQPGRATGWTSFRVESTAETSFQRLSTITTFG